MPTGPRSLPTTEEQEVAHAIEAAMLKQGMTQTRLAELVGISQPQLSKILGGTRVMTLPELLRACDALGLSAADLLRAAGY